MFLFGRFLSNFIRLGALRVIDASGGVHCYGEPSESLSPITISLHRRSLHWKLALRPDLYLGEAYMDGSLTITNGSLADFLMLCGRNLALRPSVSHYFWGRCLIRLSHWFTLWNSLRRSRRNVAHHYDLAADLYRSFLDRDMQYSCAYFPLPGTSLDDAQAAKRRHISAKLLLRPHNRVLDIGCGWGGLALELAKEEDLRVDGITISTEQLRSARDRADAAGLSHSVRFELKDYRQLATRYDRIVSVGMFEHVGPRYYSTFFRKIADLLEADGVALIHAIGSIDGPGLGNSFIRKYIFPGGYIPALSEVIPVVERSGLMITDLEILRLHYADTLRHWRERFLANWDSIAHLYDEPFKRMWEFYLAGCEMAFRHGGLMVFQLQLAKTLEAVPLTRDYIFTAEHQSSTLRETTECAA